MFADVDSHKKKKCQKKVSFLWVDGRFCFDTLKNSLLEVENYIC